MGIISFKETTILLLVNVQMLQFNMWIYILKRSITLFLLGKFKLYFQVTHFK